MIDLSSTPKSAGSEPSHRQGKPAETRIGRAIFAFFGAAVRPPYKTLPWLIWFMVIWCFCLNTKSLFLTGHFYDTDDYMRFVQVFQWLDGASWYDLNIPRLDPPHGMIMHWTRLVDIPLALLQKLQEMAGMPRLIAAQITAFIVPATLMLMLFWLACGMARPFLPRSRACLVALIVPFLRYLQFNFSPGRVDHHDYMELIAGYGFMALIRMYFFPSRWFWPVTAGVLAALSLWIGAEGLIGLVLISGGLTALLVFAGRRAVLPARRFGISLFLACCVLLPIARRPSEWTTINYDTFSLFYVIISAGVAVYFLVMSMVGTSKRAWLRFLCAPVTAAILVAGLFRAFPDFVRGPYGQVDPRFAAFFFASIQEAIPLYKMWMPLNTLHFVTAVVKAGLPILAWLSVLIQAIRNYRKPSQRLLWLLAAWYVTIPLLLAVFWEQRTLPYAEIFAVMPLTAMLLYLWALINDRYEGHARSWLQFAAFMLLGPLFPVLLSTAYNDSPFRSTVLLYPAPVGTPPCDTKALTRFLNTDRFSNRPYLILTTMNDGPELLFRTRHNFMAAPYHRDAQGNLDAIAILGESDDSKAEKLARADKVDLIAVCKAFPDMYLSPDGKGNAVARISFVFSNGKLDQTLPQKAALIQTLTYDGPSKAKIPDWLEPVPIINVPLSDGGDEYRLYRVKPVAEMKNPTPAKTGKNLPTGSTTSSSLPSKVQPSPASSPPDDATKSGGTPPKKL